MSDDHLTGKRVTRNGRTYWHLFTASGAEARPIIGIEGQLLDEVERLSAKLEEVARLLDEGAYGMATDEARSG